MKYALTGLLQLIPNNLAIPVWELRRHSEPVRFALFSFYSVPREDEIIDGLVDLLISVTHKISAQAERRVVAELIGDLIKVHGKTNLLFRIAEAANDNPVSTVREVIFPVAGEQTIADLVKEYRSDGPAYGKDGRMICSETYKIRINNFIPEKQYLKKSVILFRNWEPETGQNLC